MFNDEINVNFSIPLEQVTEHSGFKITDKADFETLFKANYSNLCAYANNFLKDLEASEEVVQEILFKLWVNREKLVINTSIQSYLFRAVRNGCLNMLKHIDIREDYKKHNEREIRIEEHAYEEEIMISELEQKIRETIDQLPPKRKNIFILSRYEGLKYNEIAEKLDISVSTVENQMVKALKFLREELADYIPLLIVCIIQIWKSNGGKWI